ncbi:EAL domain-containing protein [Novosphingobium sp. G106]|uniref:putative bifunctional diguanylate cyclase/phosphodiesterase n=1 Tax=Novosphingobium sp. G106 TaxID=2849500 RepID=UPI001C2D37AF|nr:EAL domain-containing protein [Novosphingobium sp. G106]MBV1691098.1 EAL domain-containing protein [Novosphingobium sp. G106]
MDRLAAIATEGEPAARLHDAIAALERGDAARSLHRHSATGMPTREPLIRQIQGDGGGVLGIIRFLDFDRLCVFDPSLGDQLLIAVAARLKAMLPAERLLYHVDRAHIAIWFGPVESAVLASVELGAIEYALGEPMAIGSHTIALKISTRLSELDGKEPATALTRALAQLSMATATADVAADGPAWDTEERERFAFEQDLRLAMAGGELRLCYQPLIDAANGRVFGAEALMRWNSPARGAVSPALFIPVVEATGLADEVGLWALNTAIREASGWRAKGLGDLRVAVNVSGHQLKRDDLPTLIDRTLRRHARPPEFLEIELTESVAVVDCDRASRLLAKIRALGVSVAIDDFGTGFSSLSSLRKLTFDKIKIDREFVADVDRRKDSQAICQSIIALARGLGIRVLAEGVERREEYAWLRQHGCDRFQGFYFSPPLEASTFAAFVRDGEALAEKLAVGPRAMLRSLSKSLTL